MNQMEAFKWEQKTMATTAREKERDRLESRDRSAVERKEANTTVAEVTERRVEEKQQERELDELERLVKQQARRIDNVVPEHLVEAFSTASVIEPSTTEHADHVPMIDNATTASPANPPTNRPTPRSDTSESIYAFIIRRINALEGNSSLVAGYIEEQNRVTRAMLGRAEKTWEDWRLEQDTETRGRWEQDVSAFNVKLTYSECDKRIVWAGFCPKWNSRGSSQITIDGK
jgi:hypothetical protein